MDIWRCKLEVDFPRVHFVLEERGRFIIKPLELWLEASRGKFVAHVFVSFKDGSCRSIFYWSWYDGIAIIVIDYQDVPISAAGHDGEAPSEVRKYFSCRWFHSIHNNCVDVMRLIIETVGWLKIVVLGKILGAFNVLPKLIKMAFGRGQRFGEMVTNVGGCEVRPGDKVIVVDGSN